MSIIVALISDRDGVVASDGRLFDPAQIKNGLLAKPATINSDAFNKTFTLAGGKIIGAFAGLMSFSGKTISEHVLEIAHPLLSCGCDFQGLATKIESEMKTRLTQIDRREVLFDYRKLDILLAAGANLIRSDMRIASIQFFPKQNIIASKLEIIIPDNKNWYCVMGEDKTAAAAVKLFKGNEVSCNDVASLMSLTTRAIQAGIYATDTHPHGREPACGGTIFTQRTHYPSNFKEWFLKMSKSRFAMSLLAFICAISTILMGVTGHWIFAVFWGLGAGFFVGIYCL